MHRPLGISSFTRFGIVLGSFDDGSSSHLGKKLLQLKAKLPRGRGPLARSDGASRELAGIRNSLPEQSSDGAIV